MAKLKAKRKPKGSVSKQRSQSKTLQKLSKNGKTKTLKKSERTKTAAEIFSSIRKERKIAKRRLIKKPVNNRKRKSIPRKLTTAEKAVLESMEQDEVVEVRLAGLPNTGFGQTSSTPAANTMTLRDQLLDRVKQTISYDREERYGDPLFDFETIAALKKVFWDAVNRGTGTTILDAPLLQDSMGNKYLPTSTLMPKYNQNTAFGHSIDMVFMNLGRMATAPAAEHGAALERFMDSVGYLALAYEVANKTVLNADNPEAE